MGAGEDDEALTGSTSTLVQVMDLSSNGTCLNDVAVGRNMERELGDGDVITFTKLSAKSVSSTHVGSTEYPRIVFRAAVGDAVTNRRPKRGRASVSGGDAQAAAAATGGDEGDDAAGPAWLVSELLIERLKVARPASLCAGGCNPHGCNPTCWNTGPRCFRFCNPTSLVGCSPARPACKPVCPWRRQVSKIHEKLKERARELKAEHKVEVKTEREKAAARLQEAVRLARGGAPHAARAPRPA